jgi:hypothetical protein
MKQAKFHEVCLFTWNQTGSLANHVLPPTSTVNLSSFPGGKFTAKSPPAAAVAASAASVVSMVGAPSGGFDSADNAKMDIVI